MAPVYAGKFCQSLGRGRERHACGVRRHGSGGGIFHHVAAGKGNLEVYAIELKSHVVAGQLHCLGCSEERGPVSGDGHAVGTLAVGHEGAMHLRPEGAEDLLELLGLFVVAVQIEQHADLGVVAHECSVRLVGLEDHPLALAAVGVAPESPLAQL